MSKKSTLHKELEKIVSNLKNRYSPEKIILFGSLANNDQHESHDIDLLIIKRTDKDPWARSEEADQYIDHKVPIDLLIYTPEELDLRLKMNDFFLKEIFVP